MNCGYNFHTINDLIKIYVKCVKRCILPGLWFNWYLSLRAFDLSLNEVVLNEAFKAFIRIFRI